MESCQDANNRLLISSVTIAVALVTAVRLTFSSSLTSDKHFGCCSILAIFKVSAGACVCARDKSLLSWYVDSDANEGYNVYTQTSELGVYSVDCKPYIHLHLMRFKTFLFDFF
jgi:hypothetical protein